MNDKPWTDISHHFTFLVCFALVMVIGGWVSYQGMIERERNL